MAELGLAFHSSFILAAACMARVRAEMRWYGCLFRWSQLSECREIRICSFQRRAMHFGTGCDGDVHGRHVYAALTRMSSQFSRAIPEFQPDHRTPTGLAIYQRALNPGAQHRVAVGAQQVNP